MDISLFGIIDNGGQAPSLLAIYIPRYLLSRIHKGAVVKRQHTRVQVASHAKRICELVEGRGVQTTKQMR